MLSIFFTLGSTDRSFFCHHVPTVSHTHRYGFKTTEPKSGQRQTHKPMVGCLSAGAAKDSFLQSLPFISQTETSHSQNSNCSACSDSEVILEKQFSNLTSLLRMHIKAPQIVLSKVSTEGQKFLIKSISSNIFIHIIYNSGAQEKKIFDKLSVSSGQEK